MPPEPIRPFRVAVDAARIEAILDRVRTYPWDRVPSAGDWEYGIPLAVMRELCERWTGGYEWERSRELLDSQPQFRAAIGDAPPLHFVHRTSPVDGAIPLLLLHGWPGSYWEFLHVVERLAHPAEDGDPGRPAFHVVAPSLPGYGFSGRPPQPVGPRRTAEWMAALMDRLGYDRYLVQGGDWGSCVGSWMAFDHADHCRALHLNMMGVRPSEGPSTEAEREWAVRSQRVFSAVGAYFQIQTTKPQTLGFAMMDSPVGTAAWIVEKFHGWSDLGDGGLFDVYEPDQLLTNVMLYLVTDSFATSTWMYRGHRDSGDGRLPDGARIETPTCVAAFPNDGFAGWPPRSYVEKAYRLAAWHEQPRGGHFAALEEPDRFVDSVRRFAASVDVLGAGA